ncbi:hypothetical protein KC872_02850, partial [Candidatus Kaiserbacteria bacterium]|nr:hypothetical protein [Candidatus Kaiserbacteria bacterium]
DFYAVRSAALIEDGKTSSSAGQFKTILKVTKETLSEAILSVVDDARLKLGNDFRFSVIIQECIDPDLAGVIFSRNPTGGREMVLEYNHGVGETVVGGESVKQIKFLFERSYIHKFKFSHTEELAKLAREIEDIYQWPQDIEWAIKDERVYILQTRPVTSVKEANWQGIKYLENELKNEDYYYFEQTTLAETFTKPRPLALSMLEAMYAQGGPIEEAYKKCGVKYFATDQLRMFGNELFVDKQAEVRSLFPILGYKKFNSQIPKIECLSGSFVTFANQVALSFMSLAPYQKLNQRVDELLGVNLDESDSLEKKWQFFIENYALIFEVNLRSQKALTTLRHMLKNDATNLSGLLNYDLPQLANFEQNKFTYESDSLVGNSVSIDDKSDFVETGNKSVIENTKQFDNWWNRLPEWRRHGLSPYIKKARDYMALREKARIASVCLISHVRRAVEDYGEVVFKEESELVYFATVDELVSESISLEVCKQRESQYLDNQKFSFPVRIASFIYQDENLSQESIGLSAGVTEGSLVRVEDLDAVSGSKILYTKFLTPDLTQHLDKIVGIVTEQGGLLSHMAIVARELGLPVVCVQKPLVEKSSISINGSTGEVSYL